MLLVCIVTVNKVSINKGDIYIGGKKKGKKKGEKEERIEG